MSRSWYAPRTRSKPDFRKPVGSDQRIAGGRRCVLRSSRYKREGGYQRAGKNIGGKHGEHDCFRQRNEKIARHPIEKEHGQEDDADAQRRDQGRYSNLRGAIEDRVVQLVAVFEEALDILDGDGGVIHQDADGQGESAQGHSVDRFIQKAEHE